MFRNPDPALLATDDRHGDLAALFSGDGTLTDSYAYEPFGRPTEAAGDTHPSIGFQSDWTDPDTGHVWMGARWYAPEVDTFISRDTIAKALRTPISLNRYTYAHADPIDYYDPDGHFPNLSGLRRFFNALRRAAAFKAKPQRNARALFAAAFKAQQRKQSLAAAWGKLAQRKALGRLAAARSMGGVVAALGRAPRIGPSSSPAITRIFAGGLARMRAVARAPAPSAAELLAGVRRQVAPGARPNAIAGGIHGRSREPSPPGSDLPLSPSQMTKEERAWCNESRAKQAACALFGVAARQAQNEPPWVR